MLSPEPLERELSYNKLFGKQRNNLLEFTCVLNLSYHFSEIVRVTTMTIMYVWHKQM